ncbi:hypothetical protein CERSUDRAFT_93037 [Gelatoporia subvermispora B]|uniref:FAD/NAD(P)-binding domain-containing protein n=1 Tax=Ceriporiopsis subvermispora (strain B) TaxID=914234 RepID=M2RKL5_CERS8|nr:hypothetical protein CERSUDRAFT_93037 [Gelatoporia subvermispora B]
MLLNATYSKKFRKDVEKLVRAHNIGTIFSEHVGTVPAPGKIGATSRSKKVYFAADLVHGYVRVRSTLELVSHLGVFAVGDIIKWPEQKQAAKVDSHVAAVVPNLLTFLQGKSLRRKYKGTMKMIVLPAGRIRSHAGLFTENLSVDLDQYNGGPAYLDILWGITLGDWFVRWLKKDFFIAKTRANRGL